MKKLLRIALLFVLFISSTKQANATHLLGADMQWKCLGNDTYEIILVVYRRCTDGADLLIVYAPTITSDSCSNAYAINAGALIEHLVDDITPTCYSQPKMCPSAGGTGVSTPEIPFGIERHTLRYKIFLGGNYANCCWYKLSWEQQARNSNITTGFADQDFVTESWLNRCVRPCDNGPEFKNSPIMIKCAGQDVCYNHGVLEIDGDSLSYAMALPLGGGSYLSPWSYTYPLTCLGGNNPNPNSNPPTGFNLNLLNGDMCFRPMQIGITVLKMVVTEWRKDSTGIFKVIGKTARDMQCAITAPCNNKLPTLSGPYAYEVCAGKELCITINTNDQDVTDTTTIYWYKEIKKGSWIDNNHVVKNAKGTMCWTPVDSDASTLPYYFNVSSSDDHCPLNGNTIRSYTIKVNPVPAKPTIIQNNNILTSSPGYSFQWYSDTILISGATNNSYTASNSGLYKVKVTGINGCSVFSDPYSFTVGINASALSSKIKISPNPFHNLLTLEIKDYEKPILISLFDMQGKLILQQQATAKGGTIIHTTKLNSGLYLLEITDGENKASYKVEKE
jgi:hypothetical protein